MGCYLSTDRRLRARRLDPVRRECRPRKAFRGTVSSGGLRPTFERAIPNRAAGGSSVCMVTHGGSALLSEPGSVPVLDQEMLHGNSGNRPGGTNGRSGCSSPRCRSGRRDWQIRSARRPSHGQAQPGQRPQLTVGSNHQPLGHRSHRGAGRPSERQRGDHRGGHHRRARRPGGI